METKHAVERSGERLFPALAVALFETPVDAREALESLMKIGCATERISLAARDEAADAGEQHERHNAVAEAVAAVGLTPLPARLIDMVLAVVPERGSYLLAGAVTRALISLPDLDPEADGLTPPAPLQHALARLGFTEDEAHYLDGRLLAGAVLVAVVGDQPGQLGPVREIFANHDAIHIGAAHIEDPALIDGGLPDSLLPGSRLAGETLIVDVVAPLVRLSELGEAPKPASALTGKPLLGADNETYGTIIDLFGMLPTGGDLEQYLPGYALVEHGGILGIGQRHILVPTDLLEPASGDVVRLPVAAEVIENALAFNLDFPLSRREEALICAYFGTLPAWEVEYGEDGGGPVTFR